MDYRSDVNPGLDTLIDGLPDLDLDVNRTAEYRSVADASLRTDSGELSVMIERRGRDGMIAFVYGARLTPGTYELTFSQAEEASNGTLHARLGKVESADGGTRGWFRYVTAWGSHEATLIDFLIHRLWITDLPACGVGERGEGWFYDFAMRPSVPGMTIQERAREIRRGMRKENRRPVHQPVGWSDGGEGQSGTVYNFAQDGIHVAADGDYLPLEGGRVTVRYPLIDGTALLTGRVVWVMSAASGSKRGSFAVSIDEVEDGQGGQRWARFYREIFLMGLVRR